MFRNGLIFAVFTMLALAASVSWAQLPTTTVDEAPEPIVLPDPLTPEAVRGLVAQLSDADVRALLLERLDAVAAERQAKDMNQRSVIESAQTIATDVVTNIGQSISRVPDLPGGISQGFSRFHAPRGWDGVGLLVGLTLVAIAIGLAAEWIIDQIAKPWRRRIQNETPDGLGATLGLLLRRVFLDAVGLVVFYIVTKQAIRMLLSSDAPVTPDGTRSFPDAQIAAYFVFWVIILPRMMRTLNRFLVAPNQPQLRIVHTDDWTAKFLYRQFTIVMVIWGFMSFIIPFLASHGVAMGQLRLGFWLNLAAFAVLINATVRSQDGLKMMFLGKDEDVTRSERWVANAYPWLALAVIVVSWVVIEALSSQRLYGLVAPAIATMIIIIFAPTFDTIVRGLVRHLVPPMSGEGALAEQAHHSTKRSFIRVGRVLITAIVLVGITRLWGLDLARLAESGVGAQVAGRLIEILFILLTGYLVWELVSLWINRKLAAEHTAAGIDMNSEEPGGGEGGGAGGSRMSTVLPLVLGVLKVAIAVLFALLALSNIGIDTTPLLAGAGIVGLAIGFGAQKLVTDVVSGIFFLVDDAFRTGEFVDVEGTVGTVEKISIRSMQLRHHKGPVHTIPYGEIPKLTNYSRDWVIMKLKFTVPFDTDPNKVKKIFKTIGKEMMEVPEFAEDLLQPFKSQGVFDFDDVGMIIRGKFMAKPGRQFVLRKEIYNRVKKAFEENGIEFARREVRIAIPGLDSDTELSPEQKQAVAEGAAHAAQDAMAAKMPDPAKT
ncbi:MAG: mechanosensitive ion channel domain-containing protein [Pseudomonadota bacterium]